MPFFLDDGVIAGRFPAVQLILSSLETRLHDIGLSIARHKTEIVPACTSVQNFSSQDFVGFSWVPTKTSSCQAPRLVRKSGVSRSSVDVSPKRRTHLMPSAVTTMLRGPSHSFGHVAVGPRFSTHVGRFPLPSSGRAFARQTWTSATPLAGWLVAR